MPRTTPVGIHPITSAYVETSTMSIISDSSNNSPERLLHTTATGSTLEENCETTFHKINQQYSNQFSSTLLNIACTTCVHRLTNAKLSILCRVYRREYRHLLAFIFAIDEINRSPDILPNITLGYHVYDSCGHVNKAIKDVLQILSGHTKEAPNYSCMERGALAGFIGDLISDTTLQMAQLLSLYGYTQISYGARDTLLSDRKMYPNFFRTVPDDEMQYVAIAKLLERLKWNWVGILTSDDEYGEREIRHLSKHLSDHGICIEFKILVSNENCKKIPPELRSSTTEVLIICGSVSLTYYRFLYHNVPYYTEKTFIIPDSWSMTEIFFALSNCSLAFTFPYLHIKGLLEYFYNIYPSSRPNDPLMEDILITEYRCFSNNQMKNVIIPIIHNYIDPLRNCDEKLRLHLYFPDEKTSYRVYISVYILAQALHDMDFSFKINNKKSEINSHTLKYKLFTFCVCYVVPTIPAGNKVGYVKASHGHGRGLPQHLPGPDSEEDVALAEPMTGTEEYADSDLDSLSDGGDDHWFEPELSCYVKEVQYKDQNGKVMIFNDKGELPSPMEIANWITRITYTNLTDWMLVGHFDGSLSEGQQLTLDPELITWKGDKPNALREILLLVVRQHKTIHFLRSSDPDAHYVCIVLPADSENCMRCPDDEWPNERKDRCVPRVVEFLSYTDDPIVGVFSAVSILCCLLTGLILVIFIHYQDTPIVKANNRDLSYLLLVSIMLSFLCVFLFLGHPVDVTCMLRVTSFGVIFSVAVSSLLAKSIMVCIAFKATKPGSPWRKWMGAKLSNSIICIFSLVQLIICVTWLSISPPFQDHDTHSYQGKIIIQCNEGSVIGFYSVLGYMGLLAAVSFIIAFLARTLPDSFNEAKYITFSMLVFCSVWIAMIPAYLSTRGKYMVAVEVFAIMASSSGLLGCIFFPKCYIILFRPDQNTKAAIH
ncbi:extracellular calcium-sensing receptor-like [Rana temporaria]|uniref:extracellular calcium-sensing receptor-like n=1 Tax=Rana temporaria TaxID=8407 RepID=UPI001AAD6033|nr:extracellular calcium-sensing receptor-like [Rana temporaria]